MLHVFTLPALTFIASLLRTTAASMYPLDGNLHSSGFSSQKEQKTADCVCFRTRSALVALSLDSLKASLQNAEW